MTAVVVVGAGHAGFEMASSLRRAGHQGSVTLVDSSHALPYQRPPLSKQFLGGAQPPLDVSFRPREFFGTADITLVRGDPATGIKRDTRQVVLASGVRLGYDHLVLAVGTTSRTLAVPGTSLPGVVSLRTLSDASVLRRALGHPRRMVIVGGGFIGLEVAAAAGRGGTATVVVETGDRVLPRCTAPEVSTFFRDRHTEKGVQVLLGATVAGLHADGRARVAAVELADGRLLETDLVLVAIGVHPSTSLAAAAGLDIGNGIEVDENLRTLDPAISAIGDCASFPSSRTGSRVRVESVQNAVDQARCVAAHLTGAGRPYSDLAWFWSHQYDDVLQIAGLAADQDQVVLRGEPSTGAFSAYCFRSDRLIAVESVNRPGDHAVARGLLSSGVPVSAVEVGDPSTDLRALARSRSPSGQGLPNRHVTVAVAS